MAFVELRGLTRRFGQVTAVRNLSLSIQQGEFFALLGPSGCGKTTLLRMIGGFETPDDGAILIDGADVTQMPPHLRPTNIMFQSYALFPHMNVAQNIAYGLRQIGMARPGRDRRVEEMLALGRLEALAHRRPHQLSGGQRQRVALVRALARQPKVLLLDEPLGALDRRLREETQFELMELRARLNATFIMVTHDQDEAMIMAHRIAVMENGGLAQVGAPQDIYERPASRYVAGFIGDVTLVDGTVKSITDGEALLDCGTAGTVRTNVHGSALALGSAVTLAIRPEKLSIAIRPPATAANVRKGKIAELAYLGDLRMYVIAIESGVRLRVSMANARQQQTFSRGDDVFVTWNADDGVLLTS